MAKRVNNEPLRAMAERMFVEEGMTAKSIAATLDITEQTVGRWRKGIQNDISWDDKRTQFLSTPHNIKKILMNELNHLSKGGEATIDVKAIADVNKVISTLSDKVSLQIAYTVFKETDNWIAQQDPEAAIQTSEWHKLFLLHKAQSEIS
ncbi:MAG: helix-turn-helix domain-containing protein [Chryseobacterium sp.]